MTNIHWSRRTTDPRNREREGGARTPLSPYLDREDEYDDRVNFSELTDRIETLANQTGQLCTELRGRPVKYNVQIRDLGDDNYGVIEPILVLIEEYPGDDTLIASFPEVEAFGEGVTESEAILNLKNAILDLYDELIETPSDELGDLPHVWLATLKSIIRVKRDAL